MWLPVESVRSGSVSEMLYVDDLVLMSKTMEELREKFLKWKEAFESKRLKVNLGKTKVLDQMHDPGVQMRNIVEKIEIVQNSSELGTEA